ncbi:hypothetical protein niasHT_004878 [Heterodera trifolii]|uniref:TOG domain-containing protein n=1 Tax=Heterodera trifolii TaxID=157864 RepID=A0ABD2LTX1_9BILA
MHTGSNNRIGIRSGSAASSASAGAVSDEQFRSSFEAVPNVRVESFRDLIAELQKQAALLENVNNDWTKRIKALQVLRALLVTDIGCYGALVEQSYALLGNAFLLSVKDLRSQVCREACISIAYYCEKLGTGFWRVAESILPVTMNLTQNSAKVMATSGQICNFYITKNIQHPKVLSIIVSQANSKAKEIRRTTISMIQTIIAGWDVSILDKHFPELLQCVKLGLCDADSEVRATARQTFESLQALYPAKADMLFQELEPAKQRLLVGSSTASSTHSVNSERDNLPNPNRGLYNAQNEPATQSVLRPAYPHYPPSSTAGTPVARKIGPSSMGGGAANKLQKSISTTDAKSTASQSQPGSRSSSPGRARHPPPRPPPVAAAAAAHHAPIAAAQKLQNGRDHHDIGNTPVKSAASHGQPIHKDFVRALVVHFSIPFSSDFAPLEKRGHSGEECLTKCHTVGAFLVYLAHLFLDIFQLRNDDLPAANVRSPPTVQPSHHFAPRPSGSPSTDFYGLSQRQEAVLQRISSEEHNTSGGSVGPFPRKSSANNSFVSDNKRNLSMRDSGGNTLQNGQHKWSFLSSEQLANDHEQQIAFIQEICDTIGANAVTNEKEIEEALQVLSRMIREGGITLWNDYFNTIFFAIQQIISQDLERHFNIIKISALKTLKELCLVQPKRLVAKTELLVMIILNAHECEDATVVRAAEDCGAAVANHLPTNTCMNLLLTVIDDKHSKYHQLSGAIKMLGSMLSKLPPEEVEGLLPTVVPRMTQCYDNSQSMVRRSAIICLVSISHSIGLDVLKPHLNAATLKLVDVYRERMLKRSDGGANA